MSIRPLDHKRKSLKTIKALQNRNISREQLIEVEKTDVSDYKKCLLSVSGMTCASCKSGMFFLNNPSAISGVAHIENSICKIDGVKSIAVSLMFFTATVYYDSSVITAEEIAESITDMGYASKVMEDAAGSNNIKQNFEIIGMAYPSCGDKIEANIVSMKGIESCSVSFATSIATVEYIPSIVGPRDIIEKIEFLGYKAGIVSVSVFVWRIFSGVLF